MSFEMPLHGAGGEPVDLWRTLTSHGLASLPPMHLDEDARFLEVTLRLPKGAPRTVRISEGPKRTARVEVIGRTPGRAALAEIESRVAHVLRLDENLADFYSRAETDPDLAWVGRGAGRMIRSETVFEDVVKTICTTNCTWAATIKMIDGLVANLGDASAVAPATGSSRRAFPTPEAMASVDESFYREVVRTGYRAPYFKKLATDVAEGNLDLESLARASRDEIPDVEMKKLLLALPGVGPYAAAHIMTMIGRYSLLILDSWTRPKFARLTGRKSVKDSAIERRFKPYGEFAGLAFWLFLTRDWVPSDGNA